MTRPLVKICGTTSRRDALLALDAGADFLGVILDHPPSPRHVALEDAPRVLEVLAGSRAALAMVSVNKPLQWHEAARQVLEPVVGRVFAQLHGDEEPSLARELKARGFEVWAAVGGEGEAALARAMAMLEAGADAILMDARVASTSGVIYGGTGQRGDWDLAARLVNEGARVVLAGGLEPESVAEAVAQVRPWAVDCVSGVEARKGEKDPAKVHKFVRAACGEANRRAQVLA